MVLFYFHNFDPDRNRYPDKLKKLSGFYPDNPDKNRYPDRIYIKFFFVKSVLTNKIRDIYLIKFVALFIKYLAIKFRGIYILFMIH